MHYFTNYVQFSVEGERRDTKTKTLPVMIRSLIRGDVLGSGDPFLRLCSDLEQLDLCRGKKRKCNIGTTEQTYNNLIQSKVATETNGIFQKHK